MICVSFFAEQFPRCKEFLREADYIEIRLDRSLLSNLEIKEIKSLKKIIIATCRPVGKKDFERQEILLKMVAQGVDYIDLDIERDQQMIKEMIPTLNKRKCKMIISYHNFSKTPKLAQLYKIIRKALRFNPDIIKIATMINDKKDIIKVLSLYDYDNKIGKTKIIALGMGQLGKITRIAAPFLGSPFTFASCPGVKKTADGQLNLREVRGILEKC